METKKVKGKNWLFPKKVFLCFLFLMFILFIQLCYLSLSPVIYGINMKEFSSNRNTVTNVLQSKRGTIYDSLGNTLASNVASYTVIAYVNPNITGNSSVQKHVTDVVKTAEALSPIINMDVETIKKLLNDAINKNAWQVELGPGGRNITELKKEEIENLGLPGIDFVESTKRYYPNGDFASYIIGYVRGYEQTVTENGIEKLQYNLVGEMGIESHYNDKLSGTDGSLTYQRDLSGYKIPDTPEILNPAVDGNDIYLTIDSNIQRFVEASIKEVISKYNPEWMTLTVMDAKTGEILGTSTAPSFDPNIKNIQNYENPLISTTFEPGSTMKIYTYMCAMETGLYKGDDLYQSGSIQIGDDKVSDWNRYGWGMLSYDKGFEYSSNVAVSTMMQTILDKQKLRSCLESYGFGEQTGIELSNEASGNISSFNYPIEVANASFGQGITITAIQQLQALTIISNNGKMLKPHIVKKIVDSDSNEILYETEKQESEQLVSEETVEKIKKLMYNVVNSDDYTATGRKYKIDGLDVIGKTGTAEIYDTSQGRYLDGENDYIFSFAGMYPYNDPQIIIYATMKKPTSGASSGVVEATRSVMESVAKFKKIFNDTSNIKVVDTVEIENYNNKNLSSVKTELEEHGIKVIVIGNGEIVTNQYPNSGATLVNGDKIFLVTNGNEIGLPNLIGWSLFDVQKFFELSKTNYSVSGYGYVYEQSVPSDTILRDDVTVNFKLKDKYFNDTNTE